MPRDDSPRSATVLAKLRQAMPELREAYGVGEISLFGSVARDDARPGSDVDVLVTFQGEAAFSTSRDSASASRRSSVSQSTR